MIVAPFFGEFGWEVALWTPWLRWKKKHHHENEDFIVLCAHGHEALYEDFATKIEPTRLSGRITKVDCQNVWLEGALIRDWIHIVSMIRTRRVGRNRLIDPSQMRVSWSPAPTSKCLLFRKLAEHEPKKGRIAFHARACPDKQPDRNWGLASVKMVVEQLEMSGVLEEVVFIGSRDGALCPTGAIDYRGKSIKEDVAMLATCEVIVGPSSGPMHLANQCGVPCVWWGPGEKVRVRYEKTWNPFDCPNVQVDSTWDPNPLKIAAAVAHACRI